MVNKSNSNDIIAESSLPLVSMTSCTYVNSSEGAGSANIDNSSSQTFSKAGTQRPAKEDVDDMREFVCGWGAAFINITCTFPMNKVMFRQMLHGVNTKRAVDQLKSEGFKTLYRGILPPLCQKTVSTSIMFGMYDQYYRGMKHYTPALPPGVRMSSAAALAGVTEALLCPFERVQALMQDRQFHNHYRNTWHCFRELLVHGVAEYYRGLSLILFRNSISNVMFFGLRGPIKNRLSELIDTKWWGDIAANFVSGAVLGACISTVMYPVNVLKTQQQVRVSGPFIGVLRTARTVYSQRGMRVFHGIHINYTRALVSWGIINASYEILLKLLYTT